MNLKLYTRLSALLLALGLAFSTANAQSYITGKVIKSLADNSAEMLKDMPAPFKVSQTPSKWDKESAVIIGYSRNIVMDKQNRSALSSVKFLYFFEKTRFRIKLQDNNAVNKFSEVYFRYSSYDDGFTLRLIKPGEAPRVIDPQKAVACPRGTEIPEYFQSFINSATGQEYSYYKLPVRDLEPGDILEYVSTTKSSIEVSFAGYLELAPQYEICSKEYPLMYNEIGIDTDNKTFFKSLALNGAPSFKKEAGAEKGFFRFVFVDKDRDRFKDVNFVTPLMQFPIVKFQVNYAKSEDARGAFIGQIGELKSNFSKEELAQKAWDDIEKQKKIFFGENNITVNGLLATLRGIDAKKWTEEEYINRSWYLIRNRVLYQRSYLSDKEFVCLFNGVLEDRKIKPELVISVSNQTGKLNDILFDSEIRYMMKLGDKFYFNPSDYSNPGELVESLTGNDAYIVSEPSGRNAPPGIKAIKLPDTKAADNMQVEEFDTELDAGMEKLSVTRTSAYTGIYKAKNTRELLSYHPFIFNDYQYYNGEDPTAKMKQKEQERYETNVAAAKDEFKKKRPELSKENLQREYQQKVNDVKFTLINDGRSPNKRTLSFREQFELTDMVKKAGKKYLVNLAGLIGGQLQIKDEERTREYDMDVRYPRSLNWTINFKVPAGYTVSGLNDLNTKVEHACGLFRIDAKEQNGKVVISIEKTYNAKQVPKAQWNEMLTFIDAAYNSSFKFILLSPKS
ncbi:hypothetical protein [Pseudobacter ginsenosidimutans]|uniref:DUF3857 domain-containing protein n=1 Tax=Pseudobacter ginsenosidimutans TaxID=661488 RepID=A0A4Q7N3J9_9BACT|nr:hypothetical protein [Pseudobacter ginsenosidimutans]QEC43838.1 hypothetical protein FSB84_19935 [Pseudobacter ginsenosidimutans]RZS75258.1 hypothetical protein EV199_1121 [Pseudobacter ginsenosidimutans]